MFFVVLETYSGAYLALYGRIFCTLCLGYGIRCYLFSITNKLKQTLLHPKKVLSMCLNVCFFII